MADDLDVLTETEAVAAIGAPGTNTTKLAAMVTAVSQKLDEAVGPVVIRTITDERHVDCRGRCEIELRSYPIVEVTAVAEYDVDGGELVLTEGGVDTRPADGFRLTPTKAEPELGLYLPLLARRSGSIGGTFADELLVTYDAGRFESTEAVAQRYKEAAAIALVNLWQRVQIGTGTAPADDYDAPRYPFPRFALPRAVYELLSDVWHHQPDGRPLGIA